MSIYNFKTNTNKEVAGIETISTEAAAVGVL